ncbi:hypothetical protein [uncultured Proteiniphilum sp.]|uniref:hypothetical protein n=1 Tax=uncultured Proteiniphilum sp. TaxID=497637 RepID=UPI0026018AD6|nr:hypothetical protein [uncultured Proteiniphilum sp.]
MVKTKRFVLLAALVMVLSVDSYSIESDQDFTLNKIAQASEKTSVNTNPTRLGQTDVDEVANLLLAAFAALGTVLTWQAIRRESKQQQIKRTFQAKILSDLIRHMYRNKVCICATHWKLQEEGFDKYYPSEEHLLKLKLLPEDLRFDRFDNTPAYYDILHELELKFRNFNIEVDVSLEHLKQQNIDEKTKIRDLEVLEFKSQLLTSDIINLMHTLKLPVVEEENKSSGESPLKYTPMESDNADQNSLWKKFHADIPWEYIENVRKFLASKSARYSKLHPAELPSKPCRPDHRGERTGYFDDVLQLSEYLDNDIKGEYPKIHLIEFQV